MKRIIFSSLITVALLNASSFNEIDINIDNQRDTKRVLSLIEVSAAGIPNIPTENDAKNSTIVNTTSGLVLTLVKNGVNTIYMAKYGLTQDDLISTDVEVNGLSVTVPSTAEFIQIISDGGTINFQIKGDLEETVEVTIPTNNVITPDTATTTTNEDGNEIIKTQEQTLDNGTTSKTTIEIKDDGTKESLIAITDPTTGEIQETTIEVPTDAKVEIKEDGTVIQTFETEDVSNEVTVSNSGETNAIVSISTGEKREFSVPSGASTTISNDGSTTTINEIQREDGKNIQTQIETKADGSLEAKALLDDNSNTRVTKLTSGQILARYSARAEFSNVKIQVLFDTDNELNKRVKKITGGRFFVTFSARRAFSYKYEISSTNRAIEVTGENIIITPNSEDTIFEETQSFNGNRVLKVVSGKATITADDKIIDIEVGEEYALPAIKLKTLNLVQGWNLISLPVDIVVNDIKTLGSYEKLAKFNDGSWSMDSEITDIKKSEGFWIKMSSEKEIDFSGYEYAPTATNITAKWNLLGSGKEIEVEEFKSKNSINDIYKFDAPNKQWLLTPSTINAGDGFWAKQVEEK